MVDIFADKTYYTQLSNQIITQVNDEHVLKQYLETHTLKRLCFICELNVHIVHVEH